MYLDTNTGLQLVLPNSENNFKALSSSNQEHVCTKFVYIDINVMAQQYF